MVNMGSIEERVLAFNNEEDAKFIFNKSFDELSLNEQIILRRYQNDQMNPVWKNIILDSEEKYSVDRCGNVKRISDGKFLKVYFNTNGYASVYIPELKNIKHVHRIIAEAFIPNPENKPQVNHINGNKLCNWVGNLEWVTAKENAVHAWATGLTNNSGENQGSSKYTNKQIELVCTLLESGKSYKYISEKTGVSVGTISDIRASGGWKSISMKYNIPPPEPRKYTDSQIESACKMLEDPKLTHEEISSKTGVSINALKDIMKKTSYRRISDKYHIRKRMSFGEHGKRSKYTEQQIINVCKMLSEQNCTHTMKKISEMTGVQLSTVYDILCGRKWRSISAKFDLNKSIIKKIGSTTISQESTV